MFILLFIVSCTLKFHYVLLFYIPIKIYNKIDILLVCGKTEFNENISTILNIICLSVYFNYLKIK